MTLSLSSCFRVFVFPFVRPLFFLLVSLRFPLVLKSFNGVSRQFKGCLRFSGSFKDISRKFQGCFKEVSRVFEGSLKGVSRKFHECFKEVSRLFQGSFKSV